MGTSILGGSSSTQSTTPQDLTPQAYRNLQPQVANLLSFLMSSGGPAYTTGNILGNTPLTPGNIATGQPTPGAVPGGAPGTPGTPGTGGGGGGTPVRVGGGGGGGGEHDGGNTNAWLGAGLRGAPGAPGVGGAGGAGGAGGTGNPITPGGAPGTGVTGLVNNPNFQAPTSDSLVAPMTQQQIDLMNQAVHSVQPGGNPLMDAANAQLMQTLNGNYLSPQSNPFLQAAISAAQYNTQQQFQNTVIPGLLSRYTGGNQQVQGLGSTSFANEANQAGLQYETTQANTAATMESQNYTQERQNQLAAITQANQVTNDQLQRVVTAGQQAALPQLVKDLGIQRGIQSYNDRMNALLEAIRIAGGVSSPTVASTSSGSSSSTPGLLPSLASAVGGTNFAG